MEEVIVVGGGPAGAGCALWLHQLGLPVRLLEAGPAIGGLQRRSPYVNRWMPALQGQTGQEVARRLQSQLDAAGVRYSLDCAVETVTRDRGSRHWCVAVAGQVLKARHVVLATGARHRTGGFQASERIGFGPGASMESLPVQGRTLAILGGGDNAFDQAAFALARGAGSVDIFCRRPPTARASLQQAIPAQRVHVGAFEADPTRMTVNGIPFDLIGVQFGYEACVPGGLRLPMRDGSIAVDRWGAVARHPGLYAAGEVTNFWHPCVATSFAHGVQVAKSVQAAQQAESRADPAVGTVADNPPPHRTGLPFRPQVRTAARRPAAGR